MIFNIYTTVLYIAIILFCYSELNQFGLWFLISIKRADNLAKLQHPTQLLALTNCLHIQETLGIESYKLKESNHGQMTR